MEHKHDKKQEDMMKNIEKLTYQLGYDCMGPFISLIGGEGSSNAMRLLLNAPHCYGNFKKIDKIAENNSDLEPKFKSALGQLSEASVMHGNCRFWQDYKYLVPNECATSKMELQKAKETCSKISSNS